MTSPVKNSIYNRKIESNMIKLDYINIHYPNINIQLESNAITSTPIDYYQTKQVQLVESIYSIYRVDSKVVNSIWIKSNNVVKSNAINLNRVISDRAV